MNGYHTNEFENLTAAAIDASEDILGPVIVLSG